MTTMFSITMSDRELLDATVRAARDERRATVELLALLGEVDARRLYLGEGCSSLFTYCTRVLHLSEHAAYHRMEAARTARQFPIVLELLASGDVTLTTVAMLRPHLTRDNHESLFNAARHRSKREVEHQIACLAPKPAALTVVRRVPAERPVSGAGLLAPVPREPPAVEAEALMSATHAIAVPTSVVPRPKVAALASDRYLLRVTLSADAHANLRRAQDLMRHTNRHPNPDGDAAEIVREALALLVDHLEKARLGKASRPRAGSGRPVVRNRHIPAQVRREVWTRDGGRCAFVGAQGRCEETGRLEFHHLIPYARGGATDAANIALRCRAHNSFESEKVFGLWVRQDSTQTTRSGLPAAARRTKEGPSTRLRS